MNESTVAITEADVLAFLKSAADALALKAGEPYSQVSVYYNHNGEHEWGCYCDGGNHCKGKTLTECIAAELVEIGPKARAKRLRAEAQIILDRAEKLEAEGME
jgi:hypothetical protein